MSGMSLQQLKAERDQLNLDIERASQEVNQLANRILMLEDLATKKAMLEDLKTQSNALRVKVKELEVLTNTTP
jgi:gas vesicle protein